MYVRYKEIIIESYDNNLFIKIVWQKNKPPARQVEGVALASSKKPPVII